MTNTDLATNTANKKHDDIKKSSDKKAKEFGGRDGPDPVRYGDWENKGIASDF